MNLKKKTDLLNKLSGLKLFFLPLTAAEANPSSTVVSMDGTATVQCHITAFYSFPKVIRLSVLRGLHTQRKICTATLNLTESNEKSVTKPGGGNVSCISNLSTSCSRGCKTLLRLCVHPL